MVYIIVNFDRSCVRPPVMPSMTLLPRSAQASFPGRLSFALRALQSLSHRIKLPSFFSRRVQDRRVVTVALTSASVRLENTILLNSLSRMFRRTLVSPVKSPMTASNRSGVSRDVEDRSLSMRLTTRRYWSIVPNSCSASSALLVHIEATTRRSMLLDCVSNDDDSKSWYT